MAYADFDFYRKTFYGDTLNEENAGKWLSLASDEIDILTFGRLTFAFPIIDAHIVKVRKAVCAVAEALYNIDVYQRSVSACQDEQGNYRGVVTSISSGRESITYAVNANASVYAKAASDANEQSALIKDIAVKYLANIPDNTGINLLYAGVI